MSHFTWKTLLLTLMLFACKRDQIIDNQLFVWAKNVSLRAEPTDKSREIAVLSKENKLTDLNEIGPSESVIAIGNQVYQSPWIRVKTEKGQLGWVLAWAVQPVQKQADWLLQKRLACYFGVGPKERRNELAKAFEQIETAPQLLEQWQASEALRDTLLLLLARRPESSFQPDLSWLNAVLPGFIYQKNESENQPQLFSDFKIWQKMALKTKGKEDDVWIETCLMAFPTDSVESNFPAWKFQLSETEAASQLGLGRHSKLLYQIDQAVSIGPPYAALVNVYRDQILTDIFDKRVRYWQSKEKIIQELDQLLAKPPRGLSESELEALTIRKKMFEDPLGNGIQVNLRSGE